MSDLENESRQLFMEVIDLPVSARHAYIDASNATDEVKDRVRKLLRHSEKPHDLLDRPAIETFQDLLFREGSSIQEFTLVRKLGEGGMGIVYLADDQKLHRKVALKILASRSLGSAAERFRKEAQAAARLNHPNLVQVYRAEDEGGISFIAMEYVEGETLREKLIAIPSGNASGEAANGITSKGYIQWCARIVSQVADALDHAHQQGIIHRDVKPSNILIDKQGQAKLTDFGIARIVDERTVSNGTDVTGSFSYMSPEQARVQNGGVDQRTDVFSLGVVLYELLTLQLPFTGSTLQEILRALSLDTPRSIRSLNTSVDADLSTICHKAVEKSPKDRYQTAGHMAADLRSWLAGDPILARSPSIGRRLRRTIYAKRVALALVLAPILAIGATLIGYRRLVDHRTKLDTSLLNPTDRIYVSRIETDTELVGAPHYLGTAGNGPFACDEGFVRIIVWESQQQFSEFARWLHNDQTMQIKKQDQESTQTDTLMAKILAGNESFSGPNAPSDAPTDYVDRVKPLGAFLIDRFEVSNADYARYVRATGASPPATWGGLSPPPDWDNLPACGVSHQEAQAYAEWCGKRLPTDLEWERAARGIHGFKYPWGNTVFEGDASATTQPQTEALNPANLELIRAELARRAYVFRSDEMYLGQRLGDNRFAPNSPEGPKWHDLATRGMAPVSSTVGHDDVGPELLLHMYGNVAEWTESWRGMRVDKLNEYYVRGDMWGRSSPEVPATFEGHQMRVENEPVVGIGFRCAKSVFENGMPDGP